MPPPFDPSRYVRLSEPRFALHASKGVGKFLPKLPPSPGPSTQAPVLSTPSHSFSSVSPGVQPPPPKAAPRSLCFNPVYANLHQSGLAPSIAEPPLKLLRPAPKLQLPQAQQVVEFTTSQFHKYLDTFIRCLSRASDLCALAQSLNSSENPIEHAKYLFSHFSASTLEIYLACITTILDFLETSKAKHCQINCRCPFWLITFLRHNGAAHKTEQCTVHRHSQQ